jgi:sucrose-6-phosphate hydrolase SacC (GH32 family)
MHAAPVEEVKTLRGIVNNHVALQSTNGAPSESVFDNSTGYHWSIALKFDGAKSAQLSLGTLPLQVDIEKSTLTCGKVTVPAEIKNNELKLEAFVDRGSVELFLNGGATAVSVGSDLSHRAQILKLRSGDGTVSLKGHGVNLKSVWSK